MAGGIPLWALIRDDKLYQLPALIRRGRKYGMVGLYDAIDALVKAGRILTPRDIGLCAAMNLPWLTVRRRPRVAILATGDELVEPGGALAAWLKLERAWPVPVALEAFNRIMPSFTEALTAAEVQSALDHAVAHHHAPRHRRALHVAVHVGGVDVDHLPPLGAQVAPQLIPAGLELTEPEPLPLAAEAPSN